MGRDIKVKSIEAVKYVRIKMLIKFIDIKISLVHQLFYLLESLPVYCAFSCHKFKIFTCNCCKEDGKFYWYGCFEDLIFTFIISSSRFI